MDKFHRIWYSKYKNVTKYISYIKDVFAKIKDLKISISKAVVIYSLNDLNLHFWSYFVILYYNGWEKEKLPILGKFTKTLKDK